MLSSIRDDYLLSSLSEELRKLSPFLETFIFSKRRSYLFSEYSDKCRVNKKTNRLNDIGTIWVGKACSLPKSLPGSCLGKVPTQIAPGEQFG